MRSGVDAARPVRRLAVYQGPLFYLGPVSRALAHLAALQGRAAEVRALLEQARAEATALQSPPWVARIERELSGLRATSSERPDRPRGPSIAAG